MSKSPRPRPERYHRNSRITAFGMPPAAAKVAVSAALSGSLAAAQLLGVNA